MTDGTLMTSGIFVHRLYVCLEQITPSKVGSTMIAPKRTYVCMHGGTMTIQVWFLMESVSTKVAHVWFFLYSWKKSPFQIVILKKRM